MTDDNLNTVFYLDDALSARRLIGYGGILKEIHKELNLGMRRAAILSRLRKKMTKLQMVHLKSWLIGILALRITYSNKKRDPQKVFFLCRRYMTKKPLF